MSLISNGAGESASGSFYNGVITSSLRFNEVSDSRLDSPSFASDGGDTWTWSAWVKLCDLGTRQCLFGRAGNNAGLYFNDTVNTFKFEFNDDGAVICTAPALRRDPSAWYHVAFNGNGTINKLWVNGVEQTFDSNPNLGKINEAVVHKIGFGISTTYSYDGQMADVNFVDGTALDYTAFAEFKNGILIPKEPSVTYGDNGFRLQFKGTGTSANSSGIGADTSGNDSHFTVVNLNAHDVLPDSPENNFCTLNEAANTNAAVFTEGNLVWTGDSGASRRVIGTHAVTSGKWYWEFKNTTANRMSIGIANLNFNDHHQGNDGGAFANEWVIQTDAKKLHDDNTGSPDGYGVAIGNGDLGMIAVNMDTNDIWFGREGAWFNTDGSSNSATVLGQIEAGTNTNAVFTNVAGAISPVLVRKTSNNSAILNFGQDSSFVGTETAQNEADSEGFGDFYYAPPDGYLAMCSANLPELTIGPNSGDDEQAEDYFETVLYTGNSTDDRTVAVNFAPDWVWLKSRFTSGGSVHSHFQLDTNRGATNFLKSDTNAAASDDAATLKAFTSTGFTLGNSDVINDTGTSYVAWNWKANGGTTSTLTGGTINSTVQASTKAGFSIVSYTGNATNNATVAHGLSSAPEFVITKSLGATGAWQILTNITSDYEEGDFISLNSTGAVGNSANVTFAPTSTLWKMQGGQAGNVAVTQIAYCFHSVEGYSKFGSYIGNANDNGVFVFLGFKPSFIMLKSASATSAFTSWVMYDNKRKTFNDDVGDNSNPLYANKSAAEGERGNGTSDLSGNANAIDFLSNGFKCRDNADEINATETFVYMAFAESPFKYSNSE